MTEQTLDHRQEQMIAAARQLDPHALHYHVKMRPDEATHFFSFSDENDGFPAIGPLLANIDAAIPGMNYGPNNQNTGKPHHFYLVGRESSRVLYFCMQRFYLPRDLGFDYGDLENKLRLWGRMMDADEAWTVDYPYNTINPESWFCFRFWWD